MEEAQIPIPEVVVEDEALPPRRLDEGRPLAPPQGKRATGFDRREDADQSLCDPLALRHLAREVLLPGAFAEVLVRPPLAPGQLPRVVLEPIRLG
jgi:hypothetical protein